MAKIGSKKLKTPNGTTETLKGIEDMMNLETFLDYRQGKLSVGATLLRLSGKESYQVIFGFKCLGINPILSEVEVVNALKGLQALNDLPLKETLTFHFGLFTSDSERQSILKKQMEQTTCSNLRYLIGGQMKRTRELTEKGIRKHNFLNLYITYTVEENKESRQKGGDIFDNMLHSLEKSWYQVIGAYKEVQQLALQEILLSAYQQGFNRYNRLLNNQLGLRCNAMTLEEIQQATWQLFNPTVNPTHTLPTIEIEIKKAQFNEKPTELHAKTLLIETSVPKLNRRSYVELGDNHIGVLIFAQKPELEDDPVHQLYYLWDTLLAKSSVYDIEFISQIQRVNNRAFREKVQILNKQAQADANMAAERGETDIGANLAAEAALEAQIALFKDNEPFSTATTILVHRPDEKTLKSACADICSYFRREGWVIAEEQYAWKVWLQSLKLVQWQKLLSRPFDRRRAYVTEEISRILPLIRTYSLDNQGFEFIADEGGTPIYLDLINNICRVAILAASGSGKSVLLSGIVEQLLPHQIPITLLEFPRKDGTGSFDGLAQYLPDHCAYIDIGQVNCGLNLLEPPNLKGFDPEEKKERFNDFKKEVLGILLAMVVGFDIQIPLVGINLDTIRSLLGLALKTFYEDPQIRERYGNAFTYGLNSQEWKNMPTLRDFIPFLSPARLDLNLDRGEESLNALDYIKLKLKDWLNSQLGEFLSHPTTFNSESPIQIFSLRGVNDTDAGIMGAIAYIGAFRRSLKYKNSLFVIDEAAIFLSFEAMARRIGELFANGRKSGIRLILAAQGLGSILKCAAADKILDNLDVKLVGRIHPQSIEQYVEIFKYPEMLISDNASEQYGVNTLDQCTRWLFDNGLLTPVRHYPSPELLALVANSTTEAEIRANFWKEHQGDPVQGLHQLTQKFTEQRRK